MDEGRFSYERLSALRPVIFLFFCTHKPTSFCACAALSPLLICKRPRVVRTFLHPVLYGISAIDRKVILNLASAILMDARNSGLIRCYAAHIKKASSMPMPQEAKSN
jgi:hypothetical protein